MKKRLVSGLLGLALALSVTITGCGGSGKTGSTSSGGGASSGDFTIGFSSPDMNNTFQTYLAHAAEAKAEELGATITIVDAQNDVVKQQDQINTLIQQGVDALVVVPADSSAMAAVTAAANAAGVPLVYCNVNPFGDGEEIPDGVHYVGSDETQSGTFQGEMLGEALGSGKVAILQGGLVYEATHKRTAGAKDKLAEYGIEVIAEETAEWMRDKAIDVTNNWLSAFGNELSGIVANNDEMALGAIEALKKAGRTDVLVVGIDATPDGCESVQNGEMLGTVFQDSVGQGGGAVEVAISMVKGETPSESITWVPFVPVDIDNVEEYIGLN